MADFQPFLAAHYGEKKIKIITRTRLVVAMMVHLIAADSLVTSSFVPSLLRRRRRRRRRRRQLPKQKVVVVRNGKECRDGQVCRCFDIFF